jgi:hypothetical protein
VSIDNFLKKIGNRGGIASSNNFDVHFYLTPELKKALSSYFKEEDIKIFCDEAQLPNISTGTGSITGRYLGESQVNYATSRVFSTFQLGWMLTADLLPLKFIQSWNDYIFGENMLSQKPGSGLESMRTTDRLNAKRPVRLAYPDEYRCNIRITKTEMGPESTQERAPITYVMENCWPAEVDAVPLSYGNTQVVKFTAQFQYERHYVVMNDTTQQTFKQVDTLYDENGRYIGVR